MKDKYWSIGKGALIAGLGAGAAYVLAWVGSADGSADLGIYGPILGATLSAGINALKKLAIDPAK